MTILPIGTQSSAAWWRQPAYMQRMRVFGVWVALLLMVTYAAVAVPNFATAGNLDNLLRQGAILGIVAVGQTFALIGGGMDLSVGSLMGLVVVVAAGEMGQETSTVLPVVAVIIALGLVVGLFNGVGIVTSRVYPLIWTLGTLSILQGVIFLYTDRTSGSVPDGFRALAYGQVGPVPTPFALLVVICAISWFLLTRTAFGRYVIALGSDESTARRAAIPIVRIKVATYLIVAVCASIAGLVLAARLGTGYPYAGTSFTIPSFVAPIIGGTALSGGRGGVIGTLGGVYLLTVFGNVLNLAGVSTFVQEILQGLIVIVAIGLYSFGSRRQ